MGKEKKRKKALITVFSDVTSCRFAARPGPVLQLARIFTILRR
jgi:hypothetical protein